MPDSSESAREDLLTLHDDPVALDEPMRDGDVGVIAALVGHDGQALEACPSVGRRSAVDDDELVPAHVEDRLARDGQLLDGRHVDADRPEHLRG